MKLSDAVQEVRERTDTVGSKHVTDAEIQRWLNKGFARTYERLVLAYEDYNVSVTTSTVAGTNVGFTLPADFLKLLRVDKSLSGNASANDWFRLRRIHLRDETNYFQALPRAATYPRAFGYVIRGDSVNPIPQSQSAGVYQVLYYPQFTVLSSGDTVAIGPVGEQWEEHGILHACVTVLAKEQRDPSVFMAQLAKLDSTLEDIIANRDAGEAEPPPMTDSPWYDRLVSDGWW